MQILVKGTGYVGLVVGACLAETGNDVICADIDRAKIAGLQHNIHGSPDVKHVLAAAETVGRNLTREAVVITKSTVPVGTARIVSAILGEHARVAFHVCSNPEFLKEGDAVNEYRHPNFERMLTALAKPIIVDGRNLYNPAKMLAIGFHHSSIGRPTDAMPAATKTVELPRYAMSDA